MLPFNLRPAKILTYPLHMRNAYLLLTVIALGLTSTAAIADADNDNSFHMIESKPLAELWLNAGFYSYHFQTEKNLDNNNIGLGTEYRYSTIHSITAGRFHNSDRLTSDYVAWYWQPVAWGPIRLGALVGAIDGYPRANNGAWFPLVLPVASYEYKNIGISFTVVPTYQDMLYGAISLQLKLKLM